MAAANYTQIEGDALREALLRMIERTPKASDFRKASDGRLVRFVNLRGAARRGRAV